MGVWGAGGSLLFDVKGSIRRRTIRAPFKRIIRLSVLTASVAIIGGCAVFTALPDPQTQQDRMMAFPTQNLPLDGKVTVYWDDHKIPFIDAEHDRDAAFTLGLVHAHLRLGQMEMMRYLSQGRLAEVAGPFPGIAEMEHALRVIDLGKASKEVYANMPAHSRAWLDAFVEGVNYYQARMTEFPHEHQVLGKAPEPWEAHEFLTIGRLASVDYNWPVWLKIMPLREREDWPEIWAAMLERGTKSATSFAAEGDERADQFAKLLSVAAKWGSNSFAISKDKTPTDSAIIASDPHLGVGLPNIWLIAGVKSPSYHVLGLMIPGTPFVAVGRNQDIAWGGTSLLSAASDLIDVSDLPEEQITTREIDVEVRWWFDRTIEIRETPYGPIISDVPMVPKRDGEVFALKWIGHYPSDEVTAMLDMNRASNWQEFSSALEGFSISSQNFVYADRSGNIGQITATHLPNRPLDDPEDLVLPFESIAAWDKILTSADLPKIYNPAYGYVASANNKPAEATVPIGYFFSGDDRVIRMGDVLGAAETMSVEDIRELQMDTYMDSAITLRDAIIARGREIPNLSDGAVATLEALEAWDGRYDVDAIGPIALQGTTGRVMPELIDDIQSAIFETGGNQLIAYGELIMAATPEQLNGPLAAALEGAQESMAEFPTWGDMHPLVLEHNLAMIPFVDEKYEFASLPWPGSTDTIWKGDHAISITENLTRYGAQARHISDMSDLDANWFVLLGGNDGWLNSPNFLDQAKMFQNGEMVQVPMRIENVRKAFRHHMILND